MMLDPGTKVKVIRRIERSTPYSMVQPCRFFADGPALVKPIPVGTIGTIVEHNFECDLIVSFDEEGVAGRRIPMDCVEPLGAYVNAS